MKLRFAKPSESPGSRSRFRYRNAPKEPTQNTAAKKPAGQEGVDSGCLFASPLRFLFVLQGFDYHVYLQLLDPEDFPRVHNVVGVDRLLDRTHNAHSIAVLGNQKVYLAATDTVLAGAGAAER